MKKRLLKGFLVFGLVVIFCGCGVKETKIICTKNEDRETNKLVETITVTFKNDKIYYYSINDEITYTDKEQMEQYLTAKDTLNTLYKAYGMNFTMTNNDLVINMTSEGKVKDIVEATKKLNQNIEIVKEDDTESSIISSMQEDGYSCK